MQFSKQHSHLIFTVNLYGHTITPIMQMRNQSSEKLKQIFQGHGKQQCPEE